MKGVGEGFYVEPRHGEEARQMNEQQESIKSSGNLVHELGESAAVGKGAPQRVISTEMVICSEAAAWSFSGKIHAPDGASCLMNVKQSREGFEKTSPYRAKVDDCSAVGHRSWHYSVSTGEIKSTDNGFCLQGHPVSGEIRMQPCVGEYGFAAARIGQQWVWDINSGPELSTPLFSEAEEHSVIGNFRLKHVAKGGSRKCMHLNRVNLQGDDPKGKHSIESRVELGDCKCRKCGKQQWRLQPGSRSMAMLPLVAADSQEDMIICTKAPRWAYVGALRSAKSHMCIDATKHKITGQACQVKGTAKEARAPQIWSFSVTSGQIRLESANKCLESLPTVELRTSRCEWNMKDQKYTFTAVAGPRLKKPIDAKRKPQREPLVGLFMSLAENKCIRDDGKGKLDMMPCDPNDENQHFSLTPAKGSVAMLPLLPEEPLQSLYVVDALPQKPNFKKEEKKP